MMERSAFAFWLVLTVFLTMLAVATWKWLGPPPMAQFPLPQDREGSYPTSREQVVRDRALEFMGRSIPNAPRTTPTGR